MNAPTAYERHQRELERRDRFETVVMTVIVCGFVLLAWWVS